MVISCEKNTVSQRIQVKKCHQLPQYLPEYRGIWCSKPEIHASAHFPLASFSLSAGPGTGHPTMFKFTPHFWPFPQAQSLGLRF